MNIWIKTAMIISLFVNSVFAAFIQNPIPPSSKQNFYRDTDGDGRMDQIEITFLGNISKEYIDTMVDSLTFEWIDSTGIATHYTFGAKQLFVDSKNPRIVKIDLKPIQKSFSFLTALSTMEYSSSIYGSALLYLKEGSVYPIALNDGMAPSILSANLKSLRRKGRDSLTIVFTEGVRPVEGCVSLVEYKSEKDFKVRQINASFVKWNFWMNSAVFVLDNENSDNPSISSRDSIRLKESCVSDTNGNRVSLTAQFKLLTGFYPFDIYVPNMAIDYEVKTKESLPIFSLHFDEVNEMINPDSSWGVFMEVLGNEFENALRESLNIKEKTPIQLSKLRFVFGIRIYTNLGTYVVGTRADIRGNDPRFSQNPTMLSLRWNFRDARGNKISTGAYIAKVSVLVEYDGKTVFRSDRDLNGASYIFGVLRR